MTLNLYGVGGNIKRARKDEYVFQGLQENEIFVTQFLGAKVALQYTPVKNLHFIPHMDIGIIGFDDFDDYLSNIFSPIEQWSERLKTTGLFSLGLTTSYKSVFGPLSFDASWVNETNKVKLFMGFGIPLNRSN